ncbi:MAG: hypothetical protein N2C14_33740 [Planctomycetales bacterium]
MRPRGTDLKDSFQEIFISSPMVYHFMNMVPGKEAVAVLITKKSTNQGMGWAAIRNAVKDIAETLP